jgi:hypothetical protein
MCGGLTGMNEKGTIPSLDEMGERIVRDSLTVV